MLTEYLQSAQLLQLATTNADGRPWICTVYFVVDDAQNFYWLSVPTRRHSQDIAVNPTVAATVVVKGDLPVIGIQLEGIVSQVTDATVIKSVMARYIKKYDAGKTFYDRFIAGKNEHCMCKLKPTSLYLFDELNSAINDRQEVTIDENN